MYSTFKSKKQIVFYCIILLFIFSVKGQDKENKTKWFQYLMAEMPSISLDDDMAFIQQTNAGWGRQFNNFSLFNNIGLGLIGKKAPITYKNDFIVHLGLGADCMFSINEKRLIGIEIIGGYNTILLDLFNVNTAAHWSCQAAIKTTIKSYNIGVGIRNRNFFRINENQTELYIALGFRLPLLSQ